MRFIHLSDLHFRPNWDEEIGKVLTGFLDDIPKFVKEDTYVVFSGDLVNAGSEPSYYESLRTALFQPLAAIGLGPERIIMVPGNHDVSRTVLEKDKYLFNSFDLSRFNETTLNDFISSRSFDIYHKKFQNYSKFEASVSKFACLNGDTGGTGYALSPEVGVFCLNTALFSAAGLPDLNGNPKGDRGSLPAGTRVLNRWIQSSREQKRILVMHHPIEWLWSASAHELLNMIKTNFFLTFSGHVHKDNVFSYHVTSGLGTQIAAPPLFTRKHERLGYSFLDIDGSSGMEITYRQWSERCFVSGTMFSSNDTGSVTLSPGVNTGPPGQPPSSGSPIASLLESKLRQALEFYSDFTPALIEPILGDTPEPRHLGAEQPLILSSNLMSPTLNCIVRAPPQFGLTVLGRKWARDFWCDPDPKFALMLDASSLPNHESGLQDAIRNELLGYGDTPPTVSVLILDAYDLPDTRRRRLLATLRKLYPNAGIRFLVRVDDPELLSFSPSDPTYGDFRNLYLYSLRRNQVREIVFQRTADRGAMDSERAIDAI